MSAPYTSLLGHWYGTSRAEYDRACSDGYDLIFGKKDDKVIKSNVALFKPTQSGTYTFYCHPHADKAARAGMVGTLVVEP